MQHPAWRDVLAGEAIETRPVEPVTLAPAQQGMPPCAANLGAEAIQSQQVRWDCMVLEVAIQDPLKPRTNNRYRFVPPLVELLADRGQSCTHTLLGRQPHDLELSFSVRPATMREPKEVERLRSALPPPAPPLSRKTTELNQPRLIRVQAQSELGQPFPQFLQEGSRCPHLLKAHHTVIGITSYNDLSAPWLFSPVLNPEIERVVQVNIRQQRRYYCPLRSSLYGGNPLFVFDHSRFEPFAYQSYDPLIGDPVPEKPKHPLVIDFVERSHDTLPISNTFRRRSPLSVLVIPSMADP